jgi:hypothetical protein
MRYLHEIEPGLSARLRSSSINAQHHLLSSGAGLGVLPCFIGDHDPALVPVLPDRRIIRSFWLVSHKDTHNLAECAPGGRGWASCDHAREVLLPASGGDNRVSRGDTRAKHRGYAMKIENAAAIVTGARRGWGWPAPPCWPRVAPASPCLT